mmetsp:Transcript_19490/g.50707  ORF Transcript_19490/g.50707 Transcript_19490/m.50707 type:complete len:201 (-) Transcript_19490:4275-4877(-)
MIVGTAIKVVLLDKPEDFDGDCPEAAVEEMIADLFFSGQVITASLNLVRHKPESRPHQLGVAQEYLAKFGPLVCLAEVTETVGTGGREARFIMLLERAQDGDHVVELVHQDGLSDGAINEHGVGCTPPLTSNEQCGQVAIGAFNTGPQRRGEVAPHRGNPETVDDKGALVVLACRVARMRAVTIQSLPNCPLAHVWTLNM